MSAQGSRPCAIAATLAPVRCCAAANRKTPRRRLALSSGRLPQAAVWNTRCSCKACSDPICGVHQCPPALPPRVPATSIGQRRTQGIPPPPQWPRCKATIAMRKGAHATASTERATAWHSCVSSFQQHWPFWLWRPGGKKTIMAIILNTLFCPTAAERTTLLAVLWKASHGCLNFKWFILEKQALKKSKVARMKNSCQQKNLQSFHQQNN